jgi:hypothetical protein
MSVDRLAGFESGAKPAFSTDFGSVSYTVVSTSPRSGTYHARMAAQASGAGAALAAGTALSAVDGWTWVGFWYRLNGTLANLTASGNTKPIMAVGCPTSGIRAYIAVYPDGRVDSAFHNTVFPSITAGPNASDWRFPPDTWVHFEVGWAPADAGGRYVLRVNGQTVVDFTGDTKHTGTLTTARTLWLYGPTATATADFDDVTIVVDDGVGHLDFLGPGSIDATPTFTAETANSARVSGLGLEVMSANNDPGSVRLAGLALEVMSSPPGAETTPVVLRPSLFVASSGVATSTVAWLADESDLTYVESA